MVTGRVIAMLRRSRFMNDETSASHIAPSRPWWHVRPQLLSSLAASVVVCLTVWTLAVMVIKSVHLRETWASTTQLLSAIAR